MKIRILRRILGFEKKDPEANIRPKRDENAEWRRLHNEELHSSPNIVRAIKSRRLRWAGHVARWRKVGALSKF